MKPNEIRLGNWVIDVFYKTNPVQRKIDVGDFAMFVNYGPYPLPFMPIPLTPEVLEKAGFVKVGPDDFHNSSMWKKEGFTYLYCDGSFVDNSGPYGHYCDIGNMEHLHQLQNLYFALTGEELNIEL